MGEFFLMLNSLNSSASIQFRNSHGRVDDYIWKYCEKAKTESCKMLYSLQEVDVVLQMAASFTRTVSLATFLPSLESWRWVLTSGHLLVGWPLWKCTLEKQYSQVWWGTPLPEFPRPLWRGSNQSWHDMWPLEVVLKFQAKSHYHIAMEAWCVGRQKLLLLESCLTLGVIGGLGSHSSVWICITTTSQAPSPGLLGISQIWHSCKLSLASTNALIDVRATLLEFWMRSHSPSCSSSFSFSLFAYRRLNNNKLTGRIPRELTSITTLKAV